MTIGSRMVFCLSRSLNNEKVIVKSLPGVRYMNCNKIYGAGLSRRVRSLALLRDGPTGRPVTPSIVGLPVLPFALFDSIFGSRRVISYL